MSLIKLEAGDFGEDGFSRAVYNGREILLDAAIPGEEVLVSVKPKHGKVVEVITPSDLRSEPACKLFPVCPGCRWRHLGQEGQRLFRTKMLETALDRKPDQVWQGPRQAWRYRSVFQVKKAGDMVYLGFEQARGLIYDLWDCPNLPETHRALIEKIKRFFKDQNLHFYSRLKGRGKLKAVGFFGGPDPENLVVALITQHDIRSRLLASKIAHLSPEISGLAEIRGNQAVGLHGEHHFFHRIGDFTYRMLPGAVWPENPFAHQYIAGFIKASVPPHSRIVEAGAGYLVSVHSPEPRSILITDPDPTQVSEMRSCLQANPGVSAEVNLDNLTDLSEDKQDTEVYIINTDRQNLLGFNPGKSFKVIVISTRPGQMRSNHRLLNQAGFRLEKLVAVEHKPHQVRTLILGEYVR